MNSRENSGADPEYLFSQFETCPSAVGREACQRRISSEVQTAGECSFDSAEGNWGKGNWTNSGIREFGNSGTDPN